MSHGGKGSTRRPTDEKAYQDNWDKIFGKRIRDLQEGKTKLVPTSTPLMERLNRECAHPFCACETDCKSPGNDR